MKQYWMKVLILFVFFSQIWTHATRLRFRASAIVWPDGWGLSFMRFSIREAGMKPLPRGGLHATLLVRAPLRPPPPRPPRRPESTSSLKGIDCKLQRPTPLSTMMETFAELNNVRPAGNETPESASETSFHLDVFQSIFSAQEIVKQTPQYPAIGIVSAFVALNGGRCGPFGHRGNFNHGCIVQRTSVSIVSLTPSISACRLSGHLS
ncbi:hypothetical protein DFJ73DRAFT_7416 [Zopfochytrium polystomum]|nr:hypothetical protein DFJ73DRAFT_7416 [Zopfochytrium polystomum]